MFLYPLNRHATIQYRFNKIFNFLESRVAPYSVSRGPKSLQMLAIHHGTFEHSETRLYQFPTGVRVRCAARRENRRRPYKLPSRVLTKRAPPSLSEKRRTINIARMTPMLSLHPYVFPNTN